MSWLSGGPFFELSLLISNVNEKEIWVRNFLSQLQNLSIKVILNDSLSDIETIDSDGNLKINAWLHIGGSRKTTIHFYELSKDLFVVGFYLLGDAFSAKPIQKKDYRKFQHFLTLLFGICNADIAIIAWEQDVSFIFADNQFLLKNISIPQLITDFPQSYFEYMIISKNLTGNEDVYLSR